MVRTIKNKIKAMTNNKQQTALDSIIEFCKHKMFMEASVHKVIYLSLIKFCKEQAKEMDKEQKIMDYEMGYINGGNQKKITGEQYYEQTYGGVNQ
jgi:hypothetical protein